MQQVWVHSGFARRAQHYLYGRSACGGFSQVIGRENSSVQFVQSAPNKNLSVLCDAVVIKNRKSGEAAHHKIFSKILFVIRHKNRRIGK
jgi:hypothetical protein